MALSGDGRWLVSKSVRLGSEGLGPGGQGGGVAGRERGKVLVTADGRWAAIQSGGRTHLWDFERGAAVRALGGHHWGRALVATPEGRFWVVGSRSHVVTLWDLADGSARNLGGDIRSDVAAARLGRATPGGGLRRLGRRSPGGVGPGEARRASLWNRRPGRRSQSRSAATGVGWLGLQRHGPANPVVGSDDWEGGAVMGILYHDSGGDVRWTLGSGWLR